MLDAERLTLRPRLTQPTLIARVLEGLCSTATSQAEVWHQLTTTYAVDLDAVARLLPKREPEPIWLVARPTAVDLCGMRDTQNTHR